MTAFQGGGPSGGMGFGGPRMQPQVMPRQGGLGPSMGMGFGQNSPMQPQQQNPQQPQSGAPWNKPSMGGGQQGSPMVQQQGGGYNPQSGMSLPWGYRPPMPPWMGGGGGGMGRGMMGGGFGGFMGGMGRMMMGGGRGMGGWGNSMQQMQPYMGGGYNTGINGGRPQGQLHEMPQPSTGGIGPSPNMQPPMQPQQGMGQAPNFQNPQHMYGGGNGQI